MPVRRLDRYLEVTHNEAVLCQSVKRVYAYPVSSGETAPMVCLYYRSYIPDLHPKTSHTFYDDALVCKLKLRVAATPDIRS